MTMSHDKSISIPQSYVLISTAAPASDLVCPPNCRGLYIGGAGGGTLDIIIGGATITGIPVTSFQFFPGAITTVKDESTCTDIWAIV